MSMAVQWNMSTMGARIRLKLCREWFPPIEFLFSPRAQDFRDGVSKAGRGLLDGRICVPGKQRNSVVIGSLTPSNLSSAGDAGRMLWTYPVPLVPLTCWWDGIVSQLRAYTPAPSPLSRNNHPFPTPQPASSIHPTECQNKFPKYVDLLASGFVTRRFGFPIPPQVCCPATDVRMAKRGCTSPETKNLIRLSGNFF